MRRRRPPSPIAAIRRLLELPEYAGGIHDTEDRDGFFIGDASKGKVDFVVAPRPSQLERPPVPGSKRRPCSVCLTVLWVSKTSRKYMARGAPLICPDCAARKCGGVN